MKLRRSSLLVEPPAGASSDIAFILIVFFLVCAAIQPEDGRPQSIPKSEEKEKEEEQSRNVEVELTRTGQFVNGDAVPAENFTARLADALSKKTTEADRVVLVKSSTDTTYQHWIWATGEVEKAGGTVTLQIEEEREVSVQ